MKTLNVKILLLFLAVCLSQVGWGQTTTMVNYNFNTSSGSDAGYIPVLSSGVTSTFSCTNAFATVSGVASGAGAFTSNPTAGSARTMSSAVGTNLTWFQVQLGGANLSNYSSYKVYFQTQRSGTGPTTGTLAYSTNGTTYTNVSPTISIPTSYGEFVFDISTISGLNNQSAVYFRIMASGTTTTGGTFRIDNLQVQGFLSAPCTPPTAPTVSATQTFPSCSTPTIGNLTASGTAIQWYAASVGGTALTTGTSLNNGSTYYSSQTITCESTTRTASTVIIGSCSLATLTTSPASNIATTSATIGADVTSSASTVTDKGTYYDIISSPSSNGTSQGSGLGAYTRNLTGLAPNTLYYYRGYAVNSAGTVTGTDLNFTTLHNAPTGGTATPSYTSIATTWVAPTGGGSAIFTYDVQIDDNSDFSSVTASTTGLASTVTTTSFSSGLVPSTPYFVRVRAVNAGGSSAWSVTSPSATLLPTSGTLTSGLAMWINNWSGVAPSPMNAPFIGSNVGLAQVSRLGLTTVTSTARYNSSGWNVSSNYLTITITPSSGYLLNLNGESFIAALGSSGTGPSTYDIYSSVNSYVSPIGTIANCANAINSVTLPASGYNSLPSITFRIVNNSAISCSGGAVGTGGTGGFASLTVTGSAVVGTCTAPSAPTGSSTQTFALCSAPTIASLTANGTNIKWYASASTIGGALSSSLALTNGTSYYATQNTGCESTTFYQTTVSYAGCAATFDYSWNGSTSNDWATGINWTPTRTTPNVLDKLTIAGNVSISGVPTQTIDGLYIANNANVTLSASGTNTLTIGQTTGTDFVVNSGATLNIDGTNALSIRLASGNKGSVFGNISTTPTATGHTFIASSSSDPLTFYAGATITHGGTGNVFGTTNLNSIVFNANATYVQKAGSNAFGAGQPNSVVNFNTASNYIYLLNSAISMSGRTYPNLIIKSGVATSGTGASPFSVQGLTVESGASFNISGFTGDISINGASNILGNATVVWPSTGKVTNSNTLSLNSTGTLLVTIPNLTNTGVLNVFANTLSVSSNFTNSGTINIADGGSLLQTNTSANSGGTYNISRSATNINDWSFYASPVNNGSIINLRNSPAWYFNESAATSYTNGWTAPSATMTNGLGYLAFPNNLVFSGVANNGTIPVTVSYTSTGDVTADITAAGWNLVGNPYPSSISKSGFTSLASNSGKIVGNAVYVWRSNGVGSADNYTAVGPANIPSAQAFFVKVTSGTTQLTFDNTLRGALNASTQFYRTEDVVAPKVNLRLDNGKDWQEIQVGLDPTATDGYDSALDASVFNGNPSISFYSETDGRKLAIQALASPVDGSKIVPLYYSSSKGGTYKITQFGYENPDPSVTVYLKDKTTGQETDLSTTTVVSTTLVKGSDVNRFDLVFRQSAVTGSSDNVVNGSLNVYTSNETLNLTFTNPTSSTADVYVFNTLGTEILKSNNVSTAGTKSFATSNLTKGVYIVKVGFANGKVENRKIVIE